MTTKTDEVFQESILAMRDWLTYLEEKRIEINNQLERARKRIDSAPAVEGQPASPDETPVMGAKDSWM